MNSEAIVAEALSKLYQIGHLQNRHDTLRDHLMAGLVDITQRKKRAEEDSIWALRNVSFNVQQGEVVGIIGRNGAGKSTLLKVLARITEPTSGRAVINGRVGSLLEVGTGFHPELTGRENIFLNGAILGMRKREIERQFDEIVAFAEIEQFLDTPVKRYSSGMYVRLAFAVAAHLEPEILLVDEVLAVGDAQFQKKCLGKMNDVAKQGRTVLFVSHNMGAVSRMCQRGILLRNGEISALGNIEQVIDAYIGSGAESILDWQREEQANDSAYFSRIYIGDDQARPLKYITTATRLKVFIHFEIIRQIRNLKLQFTLLDHNGDAILASNIEDAGIETPSEPGIYQVCVVLPKDLLMYKTYSIRAILWIPRVGECDRQDALKFTVEAVDSLSTSMPEGRPGTISIYCDWTLSTNNS